MSKKYTSRLILFLQGLFIFTPIILLIVWSLATRWPWPDLLPQAFSWRGWADIWRQRQRLIPIMTESILISMMVGFLSILIASSTARGLHKISLGRHRQWIFFLMSLPMLIPATIFGMGIQVHFIQLGLNGTILGVVIVHLIYSLPYANFLILDAYNQVGYHLQEQAQVCGANPWQSFRYVTLPLMLPIYLNAFIMSYIVSFSQYFLTLLIGGGRIQTYSVVMFPYLLNNDRTIASAYSLVFLAFTFVLFLIFRFIANKYLKRSQRLSQGVDL